jgi:hypothetical protein
MTSESAAHHQLRAEPTLEHRARFTDFDISTHQF